MHSVLFLEATHTQRHADRVHTEEPLRAGRRSRAGRSRTEGNKGERTSGRRLHSTTMRERESVGDEKARARGETRTQGEAHTQRGARPGRRPQRPARSRQSPLRRGHWAASMPCSRHESVAEWRRSHIQAEKPGPRKQQRIRARPHAPTCAHTPLSAPNNPVKGHNPDSRSGRAGRMKK